jgi:hypothetical protein
MNLHERAYRKELCRKGSRKRTCRRRQQRMIYPTPQGIPPTKTRENMSSTGLQRKL